MFTPGDLREYLEAMLVNYQKRGDEWREDWVTSEEVGYKLRDQIHRGAECLVCLTSKEEVDHLILCDGCGHGFHLECLGLATTPPGAWLCDDDVYYYIRWNHSPSDFSAFCSFVKIELGQ